MDLPSLALTGLFSLSVYIVILFRSFATLGLIPPHIHLLIRDFFYGALELTLFFFARTSVWDLYH
jgi:hypothetical protein